MLHLRLQYSHASRVEWMSSMTHAAASLSGLEKLLLDCSHEIDGDWTRIHSGPLVSNILQHAQRLRVLQVHCHTFSLPAQLYSLQHLELTLGGRAADIDLATLALVPNLVTLRIENVRLASEVRTLPEHLDLRPLSRLRALCLDCVVPTRLSLPEECSLAVVSDGLEPARAGVWDSVRSHIRSFTIRAGWVDVTAMADLPAVLLRKPPILQVALKFLSVGTAESPFQLSKALAQIPALKLECRLGMYLLVPEEAAWQHLVITAPQQLQWEWLSESGDIVPWLPQELTFESLSIEFGLLLGTGVLELFRACPPQDTQYQYWRGGKTHICMTKPWSAYRWCHQWECCCRACEDCLWNYWHESIWPWR